MVSWMSGLVILAGRRPSRISGHLLALRCGPHVDSRRESRGR